MFCLINYNGMQYAEVFVAMATVHINTLQLKKVNIDIYCTIGCVSIMCLQATRPIIQNKTLEGS